MMKGKHIVLGICGGIAAYKSVYLLRLFIKAGAEVQVILTPAGREFITPVTLSALSGKPVICDFFTANTGQWNSHVDLGLWADAMVIAPATASTIGKMASGIADNMLVTTYLSAKEKVFAAPAMDLDMWAHPSTQRNVSAIAADGVTIIEPASGELASHLTGKGRMAEPQEIFDTVERYFSSKESLSGKKVLITAGPTHEKIDPVRFIGNYSSGKTGFALAAECASRGAETILVAGPVSLPTPEGVRRIDITSANEMLSACMDNFPDADIAIMSAAVADYAPAEYSEIKIKREKADVMSIPLVKNPDIAATLGKIKKPGQKLIGYALESNDEHDNAVKKIKAKNLDAIVLNSLNDSPCFGCDTNNVTLIFADGSEKPLGLKDKRILASEIIDNISQ